MRALLKAVFFIALVLPGALAGLTAWVWWPALARPWLFVGASLPLLYGVAGYLLLRQFRHVGISGSAGSSGEANSVHFLRGEALHALVFFLLASTVVLWCLRVVVE